MSVIFHVFHKNKGNSTAIDRFLRETWEIQAIFIRYFFRAKVSIKKTNLAA